ncbi:MAG: PASTA domain-containing protein, partial [Pyrinomonadaceae bacterium]
AVTVEVAAIVVDGGGGWRWPIIVIAAVVLLVGGTLSWLIWRRTKPAPKPEVALYKSPDVADTGEGKAKERLERECVAPDKPCVLVEVNQVFDDHVGEGRTIRTEPAAGTEVPLGSKVLLVTSRGPLLVPSVANQPEDAARKLLETMCEQGRCKVEVSFSNDDKVAKGIAIRTVPGENEVVKTSTVTLVVSSGPELKAVGSYIGMTREVAENQIRNDGFTVGTIATIRDHRADHPFTFPNVQRQDPPPGTLRPKGSKVDIGIRVE